MNARIQIIPQSFHKTTVNVWGFEMIAEYEYDPGESPCYDVESNPGPGSPPNATLCGCRVGGVQIVEMLSPDQIERIEEKILEQM
jgi:hypothetical protein